METLSPDIRLVHIAAVITSGVLFASRGLGLLAGAGWPRAKAVRILSHTSDTILLAAAVTLALATGQYPFVEAWLTVKLVLLFAYIGLGGFAFGRKRGTAARLFCWLAALAVYALIISIARSRDPWGLLGGLLGALV